MMLKCLRCIDSFIVALNEQQIPTKHYTSGTLQSICHSFNRIKVQDRKVGCDHADTTVRLNTDQMNAPK